jgi:hypothetical protein
MKTNMRLTRQDIQGIRRKETPSRALHRTATTCWLVNQNRTISYLVSFPPYDREGWRWTWWIFPPALVLPLQWREEAFLTQLLSCSCAESQILSICCPFALRHAQGERWSVEII